MGGWGGAIVYSVSGGLQLRWAEGVEDWQTYGYWGGGVTAFDLDGDGASEVITGAYGGDLAGFSADGALLWDGGSDGALVAATPIVVDADNDGAAEIVTVRWGDGAGIEDSVSLALYQGPEDAWQPTRRIWNQQGYHVTNVREDGTVPWPQTPPWTSHNSFNVQAQRAPDECGPSGPAG